MGHDEVFHPLAADAEIAGDDDGLAGEDVGQGGVLPGPVEAEAGGAQPRDLLAVCGILEVGDDGAGGDLAHVGHFAELVQRSGGEGVDVAEMAREHLGRGLADVADAQRVEDALEGNLLRGLQALQEALCGAFLPALQADQLVAAEVVEVGRRAGEAGLVELVDRHLAGQDVHGLAADEVQQAALDLHRAAVLVGAEPSGLRLGLDERRAAVRTFVRENGPRGVRGAVRRVDARDLGDDFAALLHVHPVAHADVQQGHLVGVVEGGALDDGAAELHRREVGDGGHGAGAADLIVDAEQLRAGLFGLEFIGDRPARRLGRVAEHALAGEFVDLDHDAVRGVGKELAGGVPVVDVFLDLRDVGAEAPVRRDGQAPAGRGVERLAVGVELDGLGGDVIEGADQAAVRHFFGVGELERAGGGVARVGERRLFLRLALAVEGVEGGVGHQDLAADLEFLRIIALQLLRNAGDAADIVRDVVSLHAVAAGEGLDQLSVAVGQADGGAVELEFAAVGEGDAVQGLVGPRGEFFDLADGIGVAQREHRVAVGALDEALARAALRVGAHRGVEVGADAVGGGVGRVELGEFGLQPLQLVHQLVEVIVRHRRRIVDIIAPAVLPEGLPEFVDPDFGCFLVHSAHSRAYMRI